MKNINRSYILIRFIFVFLSLGCKHDKIAYGTEVNKIDSTINVRKLINHKLAEEIIYYYPNKEIKSKVEYKDGKQNGVYLEYYINGQVKSKGFIKNGHWINKYESFYQSGEIEKFHIIESDSFQGELTHYFKNSNLSMYCLTDFEGEFYYVIKWDTFGVKYYDEGVVFSPLIKCNYKLDFIPINKTIEFYAAVSVFDKYKTIMKAGPNINELQLLPLIGHKTSYKTSFKLPGKDQVIFIGVMIDSTGNLYKSDTTILHINVVE